MVKLHVRPENVFAARARFLCLPVSWQQGNLNTVDTWRRPLLLLLLLSLQVTASGDNSVRAGNKHSSVLHVLFI